MRPLCPQCRRGPGRPGGTKRVRQMVLGETSGTTWRSFPGPSWPPRGDGGPGYAAPGDESCGIPAPGPVRRPRAPPMRACARGERENLPPADRMRDPARSGSSSALKALTAFAGFGCTFGRRSWSWSWSNARQQMWAPKGRRWTSASSSSSSGPFGQVETCPHHSRRAGGAHTWRGPRQGFQAGRWCRCRPSFSLSALPRRPRRPRPTGRGLPGYTALHYIWAFHRAWTPPLPRVGSGLPTRVYGSTAISNPPTPPSPRK